MTTLIRLDGEIVATIGATRCFLAPRIQALPDDDPVGRTVLLMCAYALDIRAGRVSGPYRDEEALQVARIALDTFEHGG